MWGYGPGEMMGYGSGWGGGGWMMLFGGAFWLLLLVLAVGAIVWFARTALHRPYDPPGWGRGSSALDVLEERYARGEIERDEYLQKKRDMLGRGTA